MNSPGPAPVAPVASSRCHPPAPSPAETAIDDVVAGVEDELVALRRDLHAHPELSWREVRTTALVAARIARGGLAGHRSSRAPAWSPTSATAGPLVALRADMDALPVPDLTDDPGPARSRASPTPAATTCTPPRWSAPRWRSAGARAGAAARPGPAALPAGRGGDARRCAVADRAGALDDVDRIFALHCDPALDVGRSGCGEGPITGAADRVDVTLTGSGGHTSRPHLTEDLTFALGKVITELPAVLSRRIDPRAGVSVVWGIVRAGSAHNVIPATGRVGGTVRILDAVAWAEAEKLVPLLVEQIVAPYGVHAEVDYQRGVPPVVNDPVSIALLAGAVERVLGAGGHVPTRRASAARTSAGTSTGSPARWCGSAPARRAGRPTTCTRATCASTSARSASARGCSRRSARRVPRRS